MNLNALYNITEVRENANEFSARITFDSDHSILKAHFPGNPVVPGSA